MEVSVFSFIYVLTRSLDLRKSVAINSSGKIVNIDTRVKGNVFKHIPVNLPYQIGKHVY